MRSSVDSSPVAERKPRVRVVPIEIEGRDNLPKRNRNLSGSSVEDHQQKNGTSWVPEEFASSPILRSFIPEQKPKAPCERTIPIQVEGVGGKKAKTVPVKKEKPKTPKKEADPKQNGRSPSKVDNKAPAEQQSKQPLTDMIRIALSRKKIEGVLEKLKGYHADVEKFTGTNKDKQYRYLDEMLTRLMLELDDVETMGNEEVRQFRKAAVRKVQASVDLLEAKVTGGQSARDRDVEMAAASSQEETAMAVGDIVPEEGSCQVKEENAMANADNAIPDEDNSQVKEENAKATGDITMSVPDEDNCQVKEEPASMVAEKTQDVEMENNAKDGQILQEASSETRKGSEEYQVMEVDVDTTESHESTESSMEEPKCSEQSNVASGLTIEEIDSESSKDTEQVLLSNEPVVSLVDSPVAELELPTCGKAKELNIDSDILLGTTDCVNELVSQSCHVDKGNDISNLENATPIPNEHSKDVITEAL